MSDAAIFAVGGVVFIVVTWATITFLISRIRVMQAEASREGTRVSAS